MTQQSTADQQASGEFLTTEQLAELLQVPTQTVRAWRHGGTGPKGVRLGRHVRYRRADVDRWIDANERAQRPRAV